MTYPTQTFLFVEKNPTEEQDTAICSVIANGARFARIDAAAAGEDFTGALYVGAFDFVPEKLVQGFVARCPIEDLGDVLLYARAPGAAQPLLVVQYRTAEDPTDT